LAELNASVTEQAAMIAYNNDFKLMMVLCLASVPLVLLLRKGGGSTSEPVAID
jgi:DHA2 family multidrug resistance protein